MARNRTAKALVVTAISATLFATSSGVSSASESQNGSVTWKNKRTKLYLEWGRNTQQVWTDSGNGVLSRWYDEQTNDGSYVERGAIRTCLTNYNDLVYTEPCDGDASANASNWYQRWYEISTPTGWKLQNRMTGRILDSNEYGQVYTLGDFGDSDLNQRWE